MTRVTVLARARQTARAANDVSPITGAKGQRDGIGQRAVVAVCRRSVIDQLRQFALELNRLQTQSAVS